MVRIGDFIWILAFLAASSILMLPDRFEPLYELGLGSRYQTGFVTFALMGALGEAAKSRLRGSLYPRPGRLAALALIWGLHGMVLALAYWVVNGGVIMTQAAGILPGGGLNLSPNRLKGLLTSYFLTQPFFTSLFVNLGVIHPLLAAQRLAEAWLNLRRDEGGLPGLTRAVEQVNWAAFVRAELISLPLFRILLWTFVFLMPRSLWLPLSAGLAAALTGLSGLYYRSKK